jgi:hypothetical protein
MVSKAKVVSVLKGLVTVSWDLEGGVSREWIARFRPYGTRRGSGAYVISGSDPKADSDRRITWTVPEGDVDDADSFVKQSVKWTNEQYEGFVESERQSDLRNKESAREEPSEPEDAQNRLDGLNE